MLTMENVTALRMRRHCLTRRAGAAEYDALYRDLSPGLNVHWHGFGQPPCLVERADFDDVEYNGRRQRQCCFSKRMRKVFRKNEKSMLQNCNKKAKRKRRLQRVKKPM